jgi:pimeloyl-ACP methyl ester carboxylesterase
VIDVVYLHGFASSAGSSKATWFGQRFAEHGIVQRTPDFNQPDFSTLTITRMVEQVEREIAALPSRPPSVVLVGSSLGAFVAIQVALRQAAVERLVLLAPALDFSGHRLREIGDRDVDAWRQTNELNVFHHGYGRIMPLHYELFQDSQRYDAMRVELRQPVLVFQGGRDTAVDAGMVERWAKARAGVELHLLDDDHQLHASLDYIWKETARFLGLAAAGSTPAPSHPPGGARRA